MKSPFHRYLELHLKLVDLILDDKGDSVEADRVRDEMDVPWHSMSQLEHDLFNQVALVVAAAYEQHQHGSDLGVREIASDVRVEEAADRFRTE